MQATVVNVFEAEDALHETCCLLELGAHPRLGTFLRPLNVSRRATPPEAAVGELIGRRCTGADRHVSPLIPRIAVHSSLEGVQPVHQHLTIVQGFERPKPCASQLVPTADFNVRLLVKLTTSDP
jgi:hypothetical protein